MFFALRAIGQSTYAGLKWEILNESPRRPRMALVPIQKATLSAGMANARIEARRYREVLGVEFEPLPVEIIGQGKNARVQLLVHK
jgi:hypothetical protein